LKQKKLTIVDDERYIIQPSVEEQRNNQVNEMTKEDASKLLEYNINDIRYKGLVPIEGIMKRPKHKTGKQIDSKWLMEISIDNRPNDIQAPNDFLPDYIINTTTTTKNMHDLLQSISPMNDTWESVKGRQEMDARFASYHI
jgi:hypothetical protein